MKKIKITIIAFILLLGAFSTTKMSAAAAPKKIAWTFYNAERDITVIWAAGSSSVANITFNGTTWSVTTYGDNSDVEYHPENGGFLYFNTNYMISIDFGPLEHFNLVLERVY